MKYGWKKIKSDDETQSLMASYCNTPTGCMTDESSDDSQVVIYHPGLNLTPEGEWIAAPGLGDNVWSEEQLTAWRMNVERSNKVNGSQSATVPTPEIFQPECEALKEKIEELHQELAEVKAELAETDAKWLRLINRVDDSISCDYKDLSVEDEMIQGIVDQIVLMRRNLDCKLRYLCAIQEWATKPCVDVKLRLAQAHVLKLVRGEA